MTIRNGTPPVAMDRRRVPRMLGRRGRLAWRLRTWVSCWASGPMALVIACSSDPEALAMSLSWASPTRIVAGPRGHPGRPPAAPDGRLDLRAEAADRALRLGPGQPPRSDVIPARPSPPAPSSPALSSPARAPSPPRPPPPPPPPPPNPARLRTAPSASRSARMPSRSAARFTAIPYITPATGRPGSAPAKRRTYSSATSDISIRSSAAIALRSTSRSSASSSPASGLSP